MKYLYKEKVNNWLTIVNNPDLNLPIMSSSSVIFLISLGSLSKLYSSSKPPWILLHLLQIPFQINLR